MIGMGLSEVDFLRASARPRLGICLLVAGGVALAASVAVAQFSHDRRDAAEERARALEATRRASLEKRPALPPTAVQQRSLQARVELGAPWLPVLQAIEISTRDPVYLVALDIDPSTGAIRLEGEATSFDEVLAYLNSLGAQPALTGVTLVSHAEVAAAMPSAPTSLVRFSALARWSRS